MLQRSIQWRNDPTPEINSLLENISNLTFYIVHDNGLNCIVLIDKDDQIYQISLGFTIKCTCSPNKNDHCLHTLYILIKVYKISMDNPLLWQGSYTDSDINQIIKVRLTNLAKTTYSQNLHGRLQTPSYNSKEISQQNYNDINEDKNHFVVGNELFKNKRASTVVSRSRKGMKSINAIRKPLKFEAACPICYQEMSEIEGLTYCYQSCGNNFHIKCCYIWVQFKFLQNFVISCPICNCDWGEESISILAEKFYEFENRLMIHKGHFCQGCKYANNNVPIKIRKRNNSLHSPRTIKSIKGILFHCLLCNNVELCEKCYLNNQHPQHDKFLAKKDITSDWLPAKNREKLYFRKCNNQLHRLNQLNIFEELEEMNKNKSSISAEYNMDTMDVLNNSKSKLDEICIDYELTLEKYIISCFPYYNLQESIPLITINTKLSIGVPLWEARSDNMKFICVICRKFSSCPQQFRRLFCGHLVDELCLLDYLSAHNYTCPEDTIEILKGYKTALGMKNTIEIRNTISRSIEEKKSMTTIKKIGKRFNSSDHKSNNFVRDEEPIIYLSEDSKFKPNHNKVQIASQPPNIIIDGLGFKSSGQTFKRIKNVASMTNDTNYDLGPTIPRNSADKLNKTSDKKQHNNELQNGNIVNLPAGNNSTTLSMIGSKYHLIERDLYEIYMMDKNPNVNEKKRLNSPDLVTKNLIGHENCLQLLDSSTKGVYYYGNDIESANDHLLNGKFGAKNAKKYNKLNISNVQETLFNSKNQNLGNTLNLDYSFNYSEKDPLSNFQGIYGQTPGTFKDLSTPIGCVSKNLVTGCSSNSKGMATIGPIIKKKIIQPYRKQNQLDNEPLKNVILVGKNNFPIFNKCNESSTKKNFRNYKRPMTPKDNLSRIATIDSKGKIFDFDDL